MNQHAGKVRGEARVTPTQPVDGTVRRYRGKHSRKSSAVETLTVHPEVMAARPPARPGERWTIVSETEVRTVYR